MSSTEPSRPVPPGEPAGGGPTVPGSPEYLGSGDAADPGGPVGGPAGGGSGGGRRTRARTGLVAAGAVAVVAAIGGGAYGVSQLMGGGASPATVVPADALGYASLDLDPSASQKVEAFRIMRKFPGLRKQLGIGSRDDLRRAIWKGVTSEGDCPGVDYERDLAPWLGQRVAVAAVPSTGTTVLPLVVLQVTDEDKARAGVAKLEACDKGDDPDHAGIAFSGDYMLLTEKQADVDRMAGAAESSALADDGDFRAWMKRVGDPGIVTMYASKQAPAAALDAAVAGRGGAEQGFVTSARKTFKDFGGAAAVVRFRDGAVESEVVAKGLEQGMATGATVGPFMGSLPSTTTAALSVAFQKGWASTYVDRLEALTDDGSSEGMVTQLEKETGLQIPEDLETLLGTGLTVSFDSSADLRQLASSPDPADVPFGLRIEGDTKKITAIIEQLKSLAGPEGDLVTVRSADGTVAIGTDEDYVAKLLEHGTLGETSVFTDAVPEAQRATSVLYVDFDAREGWSDELADLISGGDAQVKANLAPLHAFGASTWVDDDRVQHALLRLTTD